MKKNKLSNNLNKVDLIIRKQKTEETYNEIVFVNNETIKNYYEKIKHLLSGEVVASLSQHNN